MNEVEHQTIISFRKEFYFLSNFYSARILWEGMFYPTVEHAYQAAKSNLSSERHTIKNARTPGEAKRLGRRVKSLSKDWNANRIGIMQELIWLKFMHLQLREWLLATGDAELIEGNSWGDTFWGQCPIGYGENHLGRILMETRLEAMKH